LIATAEKDYARAVAELQQANPLDPRVQLELAQALRGKGDAPAAKAALNRAADDNGLNFNLAYVRREAAKQRAVLQK
jgi:hypothetical protein